MPARCIVSNSSIVSVLKEKVEIFRDFPDSSLEELVAASRVATFEPDEFIIEFGEEGRFFGVILEGNARVMMIDDSGAEHKVADLGPAGVFGEMSLLTGDLASASVVGLGRCKVLMIPSHLFSSTVVTNPSALRRLTKLVTKRALFRGQEETRRLAETARSRSRDPYGLELQTEHPQKLLVINCGSSSLKYSLFDTGDAGGSAAGLIDRIGLPSTKHTHKAKGREWAWELPTAGHAEAFAAMVKALTAPDTGLVRSCSEIKAVGHRVVHGGESLRDPAVIDKDLIAEIERLCDLAPLHNPVNLTGIREAMKVFPAAEHVAVFDTAFHHTMPPYAYLYGLPYEYYEQKHVRKYGFHGTSHAYVSLKAAQFMGKPYGSLEMISCHLGNGASVCAIDHGRSVDTSMGFTPTEGLIMGTRCGQVDPGIFAYLMRSEGMDVDRFNALINKESGLKGLSGISADMRDIQKAAAEGHHRALLAFKAFCYSVRKYIGAYVAAMQGLDVVIFTGGIGEH
ncbi:MAG: acetate/propionate family kinase, partial [Verrucomicrobia bacterium]|nr:acetate/propionate family kinase [Verrucomicrobiota bacterium]